MTSGGNVASRVAKTLSEKQSLVLCLPTQATLDAVAAGLALYLALLKDGKSVTIASSGDIDPSFNLPSQENIQKQLSSDGDVLVVSIPYNDGGVDNISYNVEGDRLNIHITPEPGQSRIKKESVTYSYTGGKPDAIVTLYSPTLKSLGDIYESNQDQFQDIELINIDRHFTNSNYGTLNFVDKECPSMTQMVNEILRAMKTDVDKDIATNLYDGLATATNNFTAHSVNAQTFRMAAFLLDHGAEKKHARPHLSGSQSQGASQGGPQGSQASSQTSSQNVRSDQGSQAQKSTQPDQSSQKPEQKRQESSQVSRETQNDSSQKQDSQHNSGGITIDQLGSVDVDAQAKGTSENKESTESQREPDVQTETQQEGNQTREGQAPEGAKPQLKPQIFQGGVNKG